MASRKDTNRANHRGEIPRWSVLAILQKTNKQRFQLLSHEPTTHVLMGVAVFSLSDNLQSQQWCDLNFTNDGVWEKELGSFIDKLAHATVKMSSRRNLVSCTMIVIK